MSDQIEKVDPAGLPAKVVDIALAFRQAGWIGFWVQLVLGVIAAITLLFAGPAARQLNNPGSGFGLFFTVCSIVALGLSIFWTFRYPRIARQLRTTDPKLRPSKAETLKLLRQGVMIPLIGMLLSLIGAQAIVGGLVAKAAQTQGVLATDPGKFIQALDMFVVLANTNTITALFAGVLTSLWLLNRVSR